MTELMLTFPKKNGTMRLIGRESPLFGARVNRVLPRPIFFCRGKCGKLSGMEKSTAHTIVTIGAIIVVGDWMILSALADSRKANAEAIAELRAEMKADDSGEQTPPSN